MRGEPRRHFSLQLQCFPPRQACDARLNRLYIQLFSHGLLHSRAISLMLAGYARRPLLYTVRAVRAFGLTEGCARKKSIAGRSGRLRLPPDSSVPVAVVKEEHVRVTAMLRPRVRQKRGAPIANPSRGNAARNIATALLTQCCGWPRVSQEIYRSRSIGLSSRVCLQLATCMRKARSLRPPRPL